MKQDIRVWVGLIILAILLGGGGIYYWLTNNETELVESIELEADASGVNWDNYQTKSVSLDDSLTITNAGTYILSGEIANGSIVVDANGPVKLVLNGVKITNLAGPAIEVKDAEQVMIYLADGTSNSLTDGGTYASEDNATATGTVYSKARLQFDGKGELQVTGNSLHAIVAKDDLEIFNGNYNFVAKQDAINGKQLVRIQDGNFEIEAGDDGIHADEELQILAGTVNVVDSREGLEASKITIESGLINIIASDDGINAADGSTSEAMGGLMANDVASDNSLTINGGEIYVNASGDGLDANGSIYVNGGMIIVDGPTSGADGALDYDGELKITGGTLLAVGASQMAQGISNTSTQYGLMVNLGTNYTSGTEITILNDVGQTIFTWASKKAFSSVVFSSAELIKGSTYNVKANDNLVATLTLENILTTSGNMGMMGGGDRFGDMKGEMMAPGDSRPGMPSGERPNGQAGRGALGPDV